MKLALEKAKINWKKIDFLYINAHATGTLEGELVEAEAIRKAVGKYLAKCLVTSFKGQIGHLLGAAAAVESIFLLKQMEEGIILPNFNLEEVDPKCAFLNLPTARIEREIECTLKNAFGFGGQNACLVYKEFKGV